ncbi:unnamed protein product [Closterium sp. Yama58-4]|nr:unnamed protein product [Closterium sp. Yama58-4]
MPVRSAPSLAQVAQRRLLAQMSAISASTRRTQNYPRPIIAPSSVCFTGMISVIDITIFIARRCSSTTSSTTSSASTSCGMSNALESIQEQQSGEETEGEGEGEGEGAGEGEGGGEGGKGSVGRGGGEGGTTEKGGGVKGDGGGMSEKRGGSIGIGQLEWLKESRVADVMGKTEETRTMLVLDPHATVLQAMELLGSRGFHRALVPNVCPCDHDKTTAMPMPALLQSRLGGVEGGTTGEEYRVLSQMDIAAFMLKHEGLLGLALAKSIDEIGLVWPSVVSVTPSTPLLDAFNMFRIRGISAVAVVQPKPAPPAVMVEEGVAHGGVRQCADRHSLSIRCQAGGGWYSALPRAHHHRS